ncbi:MAG: hypothetical protein WA633_07290 [Stellaceae bacterium]
MSSGPNNLGFLALVAVFLVSTLIAIVVPLHQSGLLTGFARSFPVTKLHHETGFAYIAAFPAPTMLELGTTKYSLLEDGRPLGPANSVHDEIRNKGGGRYSFWKGSLYLSASDNTDPAASKHSYALVTPIPVPLWLILIDLAAATLSAVRLSYHPVSSRMIGAVFGHPIMARMFQGVLAKAPGQAVLLNAAIYAVAWLIAPWRFFLGADGTPYDWLRHASLLLLALAAYRWRADRLPACLRIFLRSIALYLIFLSLARWTPVLGSPIRADNIPLWFEIRDDRFIAAAMAALGWFRPACLLYAVAENLWFRRAIERMVDQPFSVLDELPMAEMVTFLILSALLIEGAHLLRAWGKTGGFYRGPRLHGISNPVRKMALEYTLLICLAIHFSNYFYSAVAKWTLDGPIGSWVIANPTHLLVANARELGTSGLLAMPDRGDNLLAQLAKLDTVNNVITIATQLGSVVALCVPAGAPFLALIYDVWHLGVGFLAGIFFWKWMTANVCFALALPRARCPISTGMRALLVLVLLTATYRFSLFAAGWYDTPLVNTVKVYAVTRSGGEVEVPPNFYRTVSYLFTTQYPWMPALQKAFGQSNTFGTVYHWTDFQRAESCGEWPSRPGPAGVPLTTFVKPQLVGIIRAAHRDELAREGGTGGPAQGFDLFPHHVFSVPTAFPAFESLDLADVRSYRVRIEEICQADEKEGRRVIRSADWEIPLASE